MTELRIKSPMFRGLVTLSQDEDQEGYWQADMAGYEPLCIQAPTMHEAVMQLQLQVATFRLTKEEKIKREIRAREASERMKANPTLPHIRAVDEAVKNKKDKAKAG